MPPAGAYNQQQRRSALVLLRTLLQVPVTSILNAFKHTAKGDNNHRAAFLRELGSTKASSMGEQ
jgi:hypothetical protein